MNIGVLTVHGYDFHPNGRLREAALSRGHELRLIHPGHTLCGLVPDGFSLRMDPPGPPPDIVLPRQGSPMGDYGIVVIRHLQNLGIPLLNGLKGVVIARNQFLTLQTLAAQGIPVPDSYFITRPESVFTAVDQLGGYPVVIKPLNGMGGDGVVRIGSVQEARHYLQTALDPMKGLLVQRFLPPESRLDARILVIGQTVAGAVALSPGHGEFRANVHQNGRPRPYSPPRSLAETAVNAARCCGLEVAGIDLILDRDGRPLILEVNYSPGFRGMETATGLDIAGKIIDHAVNFLKNRQNG